MKSKSASVKEWVFRMFLPKRRKNEQTSFGNKYALQNFLNDNISKHAWDIGVWSYGFPEIFGVGEAHLQIGNYVSIARGCKIFLGFEHNVDWVTTYPFPASHSAFPDASSVKGHPRSKGPVLIGNDVWIGDDVTILSGSQIGDGAVIGAKSLVSGSIKPYSIVGGVPARLIKYRFDVNAIESLLSIAWWNWSDKDVQDALPFLCSKGVDAFIEKYSRN